MMKADNLTDTQLDKLPKYARDLINTYRARVALLERELEVQKEAKVIAAEAAPLVHDPYSSYPTGLSDEEVVVHLTDNRPSEYSMDYISFRRVKDLNDKFYVLVHTGRNRLVMIPQSGNMVRLQLEEERR